MVLASRAQRGFQSGAPWVSRVVAFLRESVIDIAAVCHEPEGYCLRLWDSAAGVVLREIHLIDQEWVHAVHVSRSGDAIAIGYGPGYLQVCHCRRGRVERFHKRFGTSGLTEFAFQQDGPIIASSTRDGHVYIVNVSTQQMISDASFDLVISMTWSRCGSLLAIATVHDLCIHDIRNGDYRWYDDFLGSCRNITALGFSSERNLLAVGGWEKILLSEEEARPARVSTELDQNIMHGQPVFLEDCHAAEAFAWLPQGLAVVTLIYEWSETGVYDSHVRIFDTGTSSWVHTVGLQPGLVVRCFAIDTYGHTIAAATEDGMCFWDVGCASWLSRQPLQIAYELANSQLLAVLD